MGQLFVMPDTFSIEVDRMILHDRQLIVNCRTRDYESSQRYEYSLRARQNKEGVYEAELQDLGNIYEPGDGSLHILRVAPTAEGCSVDGFWWEREVGAWKFSGMLRPYKEA